jgi:hypothetical protein
MHAVLYAALFFETSTDDECDPDLAVKQLEQVASSLAQLCPTSRSSSGRSRSEQRRAILAPTSQRRFVRLPTSCFRAPSARVTFPNARPRQRLITPPAARRLESVVSGDAHVCAWVIRGEARDHVQCDAPRFCGIPSKWNIERQPTRTAREELAALTSIGSRECDESVHLARGLNFEFHPGSIGPYLRDG